MVHRFLICILIYCITLTLHAQREIKPCPKEPSFIKTLGFDPLWTGLSTGEKNKMGLVLVAFEKLPGLRAPTPTTPKLSIYQHPSWLTGGYLSSITFDSKGNAYTIPAPWISMLYNHPSKINTIYKVDEYTGEMKEWLSLPLSNKSLVNNPYGLLGISYDCTADLIIAASVAGSNRYKENGVVFLVQLANQKIIDTLQHKDFIAVAVGIDEKGAKRLYLGKARSGEIISIPISANGKFIRSALRKELSLEGYGPRGDDKARKIKFIGNQLQVSGIAFNYNLQAASEKPETTYTFNWNTITKKWDLIDYK